MVDGGAGKPEQGAWEQEARRLDWHRGWDETFSGDFGAGTGRWFSGGEIDVCGNACDRWADAEPGRVALVWEPSDPDDAPVTLTYGDLADRVTRAAAGLARLGVAPGDTVTIYLPVTPEAVVTMLACARLGAVHSVVFSGFSAASLAARVRDCGSKLVVTADEAPRGTKRHPLKATVDEALASLPEVRSVVVARTGSPVPMTPGRDFRWADTLGAPGSCPPRAAPATDPLFVLYTSGSTGPPKGIVHSAGGYAVFAAYTFREVFAFAPGDVFFCTADVGWITGHTYLVYGPLLSGATVLAYEGVPTHPDPGRLWRIAERHRATHVYTAPTLVRTLKAAGDSWPAAADLSAVRRLGSVGEPIDPEAWRWFHEKVGGGRCPIADTWWQTETGGVMIAPPPGDPPSKPGSARRPLRGIDPVLLDDEGREVTTPGTRGNLCLRSPWPGMLATTWGDHSRCVETYFTRFPGHYFTGDAAVRDDEGDYRVLGRVDDVLNVSGHRLGTAEIEEAAAGAPGVAEAAAVGVPHPVKGEEVVLFVVGSGPGDPRKPASDAVAAALGAFARPGAVYAVPGLPKTRSGKVMRRILRAAAAGETAEFGDVSTLTDPSVVEGITEGVRLARAAGGGPA